eukprot:1193720-Prorocentrum_minimum.AAC.3
MITSYQQRRYSRFPEAFTLVRLDARSGTQDLYPYWARLLRRCTVRPMTVRVSLLGSYGQGCQM